MRIAIALTGAVSTLTLVAGPALAEGKMDRARAAVAEARGKVQTLSTVNAGGDYPRMVAQAQAALRAAEDDLKASHKEQAITDAHRASELADTAIGLSQKQQADANAATQAAAVAGTVAAQQDAAAANARADAAQQAADAAAADAAAARAAPPVVVAPQPTTTVTTETTKTAAAPVATRAAPRRVVKRTVHRSAARPTVTEKTTTTVQTN